MPVIREYDDGTVISRERGKFDDWCIYVDGKAPYDKDYLTQILQLAQRHGVENVFQDFLILYQNTSSELDNNVFEGLIPYISENYDEERNAVEKLFGILYCVMLAEENRYYGSTKTKLGRSIKGLAVYQILFEDYSIDEACNFSKSRSWKEIYQLCYERGLQR